jgi:glycosyltransferase involved in cell wall biosynthesis
MRDQLLNHAPWYEASRIVVIPVAISERYQFQAKAFNKEAPRILQVGTADNKNVPRLIAALTGTKCVLDIVGSPRPEYFALLEESGLQYSYSTGLHIEQMIEKYCQADIVSFASTYEGFGMPILEAQASGRPVVTSNIGSMPEVAGRGALLVNPYNVQEIRQAVFRICEDPFLREELVAEGLGNVSRFNGAAIARQYADLYRRVAGEV